MSMVTACARWGAAATQDLGTGTWTIGTQMTASLTGLPLDRAKFELGDSVLPPSGVSGGSATAGGLAQALTEATDALKTNLFKLARRRHERAARFSGIGRRQTAGDGERKTDGLPTVDLVKKSGRAFVEGAGVAAEQKGQPGMVPPPSSKPTKAGGGGEDFNANERKYAMQSFGAHFVE